MAKPVMVNFLGTYKREAYLYIITTISVYQTLTQRNGSSVFEPLVKVSLMRRLIEAL